LKNHIVGFLAVILMGVCIFQGCSHTENEAMTTLTTTRMAEKMNYDQITPAEAKKIMDTEKNYIVLDVRTEEEYNEGHIEGAVLIPDYEINTKAESILKDKDQLLLVYCRSGRRSKLAAESLAALGYTNIKEFGGIIDWQYEIVTE
jgi:rhodanese-related sulfurtransferase